MSVEESELRAHNYRDFGAPGFERWSSPYSPERLFSTSEALAELHEKQRAGQPVPDPTTVRLEKP